MVARTTGVSWLAERGFMLLNTALKVETVAALFLAWMMVFVFPLGWIQRLFAPTRPPVEPDAMDRGGATCHVSPRASAVARRVARLSSTMPFPTTCLVQAIAGALLLRRRGMRDGTIRLGVRKSGSTLEAHAWLLYQGSVVLGGDAMEGFTPLADIPAASSHR